MMKAAKNIYFQATVLMAILVGGYLLLGLLAYAMPDWRVREHVQRTVSRGDLAEEYPVGLVPLGYNAQDNFTDALILNQCLMMRSEGLQGMLLLPRFELTKNQCRDLRTLLAQPEMHNAVDSLDGSRIVRYPRYWHGSTFCARILLTVMSYQSIRLLLYLLSSGLLLWCALRLWGQGQRGLVVAGAVALLLCNVYLMQFSLQLVQVLLISVSGVLVLSYMPSADTRRQLLLFLVVGSLTAFLDLITVPTLTLGLPLVALIALRGEQQMGRGVVMVLRVALWWLVGYVATWALKWGIATLLTGEDVFANAYGQAYNWSEGGGSYIGRAIADNLRFVRWGYVALAAVGLLLAAIVKPQCGRGWVSTVQYLLAALVPFVYYILMAHPAWHHSWFNYRALATTIAALLMGIFSAAARRKN